MLDSIEKNPPSKTPAIILAVSIIFFVLLFGICGLGTLHCFGPCGCDSIWGIKIPASPPSPRPPLPQDDTPAIAEIARKAGHPDALAVSFATLSNFEFTAPEMGK